MVIKWDITIPELSGEERRGVYVYLPESYDWDQERRYPVLYMFDGHNLFFDSDATYGKSWGMKEYLDRTGTPLIVAAVECSHSPDHGRLREYAPYSFQEAGLGQITGRGRETMEWMIHTLKPEIDRRFRTLPGREHTFLAGSSMGGLMSLYGVLQYNRVFSRAGVLSPSLWTAPRELCALIRRAQVGRDTVIYMDYGSEELQARSSMEKIFGQTVSDLLARHILLTSRVVPGGTHCEACWERQLPFLIPTLLYGI